MKIATRPSRQVFVLGMDKSIIEWRQQTTLLPMIQMNPLPYPYYRNMVVLLLMFEVVVAFKIALQGHVPYGEMEKVRHALCALATSLLIVR